jgi:hypothetical protein
MATQILAARLRQPGPGAMPAPEPVREITTVPRWVARALRPSLVLPTPYPNQETFRRIEDREFVDMDRIFDSHGGMASGNEIASELGRHTSQSISVVARWIVGRKIVNIAWRSHILIPRFQFTADNGQIRPVVSGVIAELEGVFDDWEIARWFSQPNTWLHDMRPLQLVAIDDGAVIQAARTDRFIARG